MKRLSFFLMLFMLLRQGLQAGGVITKVEIFDKQQGSVVLDLCIGPKEAAEEGTYRDAIALADFYMEEGSDPKELVLVADRLDNAFHKHDFYKQTGILHGFFLKTLETTERHKQRRLDPLGRGVLSTRLIFKGKGILRPSDAQLVREEGQPIRYRFRLTMLEDSAKPPSPGDGYAKYQTLSRRDTAKPFAPLLSVEEEGARQKELLALVQARGADEYLTAIHGLRHISVETGLGLVKTQLSPDGQISMAPGRGQLIITDRRDYLANVLQILARVDQQDPEVQIEVKIVEVAKSGGQELGLDWSGSTAHNGTSLAGSLTTLPAAAADPAGLASAGPAAELTRATVLNRLTARISALVEEGRAKVMAEPKLLVANHSPGEFKMTERQPFLVRRSMAESIKDSASSLAQGGQENRDTHKSIKENSNYTFPEVRAVNVAPLANTVSHSDKIDRDEQELQSSDRSSSETKSGHDTALTQTWEEIMLETGISLTVTPHIRPSGVIELELNPKITELAATAAAKADTPAVSVRELRTKAFVRDGDTLVLGGLVYEKNIVRTRGVPGLSAIPGVRHLFQTTSRRRVETELLFLVKTNIIQL